MPPGAGEAVKAAIDAGKTISTHQEGVSLGSVSSWLTVFAIFVSLAVAYLKFLPSFTSVTNKRLDALDEQRRKDDEIRRQEAATMRQEIKELRETVETAMQAAREADTRSAILRAVVAMLTAEIRRTDPDNPVLQQAQSMIRDAAMGDLGLGRGMRDIAQKVVDLK